MVMGQMLSIRQETSELNVAKGGSTSLFVDRSSTVASDNNDGFSWTRPKLTIGGAIDDSDSWTEIYIRPGTYAETVTIDQYNTKLIGAVQEGVNRVIIAPTADSGVICNTGYLEMSGISVETTDQYGIELSGPGHFIHDCVIDTVSTGAAPMYGININNCQRSNVVGCYLDGNSDEDVIGILVNGGSSDIGILGNFFTDWGDIAVTGYGIGIDNSDRISVLPGMLNAHYIPNIFNSGYIGVYFYVDASYCCHNVHHNGFFDNADYDIYEPNGQAASGISIEANFWGYAGWFDDSNNDGISNWIYYAGGNVDHHGLSSLYSWMHVNTPRGDYVVI